MLQQCLNDRKMEKYLFMRGPIDVGQWWPNSRDNFGSVPELLASRIKFARRPSVRYTDRKWRTSSLCHSNVFLYCISIGTYKRWLWYLFFYLYIYVDSCCCWWLRCFDIDHINKIYWLMILKCACVPIFFANIKLQMYR